MDHFIVSARKYRPVTFDSVVGQQHITSTLKNAIRNRQLAQAFLFCGPRGVGKTTCARILAKTINCERPTENVEACGECDNCRSFLSGASFSIHELDAASNNSVEDIRNLIEQVRIPPQQGKYKIYIIDEVHMLSQAAFNAFLKTLEEPPSYAIFILATTEKHRILPTILSRCQIFDFNRIRVEDMANHLARIADEEQITYEYDGLHIIAQKADGGLRDALSMFDQIVSFSNKQVTYQSVISNLNVLDTDYYFKVADAIHRSDVPAVLLMFDEILGHGFDGSHFIGGLAGHFRDLLVAREPATVTLMEVSDRVRARYLEQSAGFSTALLLSALNIANQCEIAYKSSRNPRLQVELALIKMCHIRSALKLDPAGFAAVPVEATPGTSAGTASGTPAGVPSGVSVVVSAETGPGIEKKKTDPIAVVSATEAASSAETPSSTEVISRTEATSSAEVTSPTEAPIVPVTASTPQAAAAPVAAHPEISVPVPEPEAAATVSGTAHSWNKVKLGGELGALDTSIFGQAKDRSETNEETELVTGSSFDAIEPERLLKEWHRVADTFKEANKINIFTLMTANVPKLIAENQIEVLLENSIQENLLLLEKRDIVNELRQKLNNFAIDIVTVTNSEDTVKKPYTAQEKYQAMVQKNNLLDQMRQDFNLGLE